MSISFLHQTSRFFLNSSRSISKQKSSRLGATLVEFAIVFPLLLIVLLGIISFAYVYQARSMLTKGAEQGVSLASVIPDLENRDSDNWSQLADQIRQEAIQFPTNSFFVNAIPDLQGEPAAYGTRVTAVNLDLGPDNLPDLTEYFTNNPIEVEVEAVVRNFIWFLPDFNLSVKAVGFREPRFFSTLPRPYDCTGNPVSLREGVAPGPTDCPCSHAPDHPRMWADSAGNCFCVAGFEPSGDPNDPGTTCNCPPGLVDTNPYSTDPSVCQCPACPQPYFEQHPVNHLDDPCGCFCPENSSFNEGVCACDGNFEDQYPDIPGELVCGCPGSVSDMCAAFGQSFNEKDCECKPCVEPLEYDPLTGECVCPEGDVNACNDAGQPIDPVTCQCGTCPQTTLCGEQEYRCKADGSGCVCNVPCMQNFCHSQGKLFSLGNGNCTSSHQNHCNCKSCPTGQDYNPITKTCCPTGTPNFVDGACICNHSGTCPSNQFYENCQCKPCPAGQIQNPEDPTECICENDASSCQTPDQWNPVTCQCCPDAHVWNPDTQTCICPEYCVAGGGCHSVPQNPNNTCQVEDNGTWNFSECLCTPCPPQQMSIAGYICLCDEAEANCHWPTQVLVGVPQQVNPESCVCECLPGMVPAPGGCSGEDCCMPENCQTVPCGWINGEWVIFE